MKLHIFNPENDMALASGSPGYTPPANIREYCRRHRFLPRLWASPGDVVWDGESSLAHLFANEAEAPEICPWGWSPALVHRLTLAGVPARYLPDREWLSRLRRLSSRESTVPVQQRWGMEVSVCHTLEEVERDVALRGRVVMKSPWSSSGKGLMQTDNRNWRGWVRRTLAAQGAVVVEEYLDRRLDLAMEFRVHSGVAEYMGLNVFRTDDRGHFLENLHAGGQSNEAYVCSLLRRPEGLAEVREQWLWDLPRLAPWYDGPVGVDMLVQPDGVLQSCIEINWRMTMGMVAVITRAAGGETQHQ